MDIKDQYNLTLRVIDELEAKIADTNAPADDIHILTNILQQHISTLEQHPNRNHLSKDDTISLAGRVESLQHKLVNAREQTRSKLKKHSARMTAQKSYTKNK